LIREGYTMGSNGAMHAPASMSGAPTAGNSAFASSTDDLISQGYTMGSDGAMHAPASVNGAPTAGNSAFYNSGYAEAHTVSTVYGPPTGGTGGTYYYQTVNNPSLVYAPPTPPTGNVVVPNPGVTHTTVSTVYGPPTGGNRFSIRNGIQTIKKLNSVGSGPGNHAGLATGVNIANMAYDEYADDNRRVN
jgi:hypothetical protein